MVSWGHVGALRHPLPRRAARRGGGGAARAAGGGGEERPRREREEPEMLPALPGPRSLSHRRRTEQPRAGSRGPGQPGRRGPERRARSG